MPLSDCDRLNPELSALVDDELDQATRAQVQAHVAGCPACRSALNDLRAVAAAVSAIPRASSPADVAARLTAARASRPAAPERVENPLIFRLWTVRLLSSAALVMIGLVIGWNLPSRALEPGSAPSASRQPPLLDLAAAKPGVSIYGEVEPELEDAAGAGGGVRREIAHAPELARAPAKMGMARTAGASQPPAVASRDANKPAAAPDQAKGVDDFTWRELAAMGYVGEGPDTEEHRAERKETADFAEALAGALPGNAGDATAPVAGADDAARVPADVGSAGRDFAARAPARTGPAAEGPPQTPSQIVDVTVRPLDAVEFRNAVNVLAAAASEPMAQDGLRRVANQGDESLEKRKTEPAGVQSGGDSLRPTEGYQTILQVPAEQALWLINNLEAQAPNRCDVKLPASLAPQLATGMAEPQVAPEESQFGEDKHLQSAAAGHAGTPVASGERADRESSTQAGRSDGADAYSTRTGGERDRAAPSAPASEGSSADSAGGVLRDQAAAPRSEVAKQSPRQRTSSQPEEGPYRTHEGRGMASQRDGLQQDARGLEARQQLRRQAPVQQLMFRVSIAPPNPQNAAQPTSVPAAP